MSFVIDIPSIFTSQIQIPLRVNNTILSGNENIKGSLYINGSIILNESNSDTSNIVYYDYLDISTILNVGNKLVVDNINIIEALSLKQDETADIIVNSIRVTQLEPELSNNLTSKHYVDSRISKIKTTIDDGTLTISKTAGLQDELNNKQNLTIDIDVCSNSITVNQLIPVQSNNLTSKYYVDLQMNTIQEKVQTNDLSINDISELQTILDSKQANIQLNDLSINDISGLNTLLIGLQQNKQNNIISQTDISLHNLTLSGEIIVDRSFGSNRFIVNNNIRVMGELDFSNASIGTAFNVSQFGPEQVARFDAGSDALLIDTSGDTTIYKNLQVIGNVSMNNGYISTLDVSNLVLLDDDVLAISNIKELQVKLAEIEPTFTTNLTFKDLHILKNLSVDGSFNLSNLIQKDITINEKILISTQLDISNEGTGPALNVSQVGTGSVAIFNSGEEGNALLIDSSGNTTIYKKLEVIGDVSMNNASITTLKVSNLILRDDALGISKIKDLQTTLNEKQPNITSETDISLHDLRMSGNLVVDGEFISNHFIVKNNILVRGELDISNASNGPVLNVLQVGTGSVALFNSGEEGDSLLIDSSGNTTIYKKLEVNDDVSMNNGSTTTLEVSNLVLRDDALAISKIKELQTTLSGKQPNITSETDISFHDLRMSGNLVVDGSFISNHFIVKNNILVMGELDISNEGTGPALNVSQVGTGSVAIFNSGEEGNALLIDSSGNTTIYKKLEVIGDVSMNNASTTTLEVSNLVLRDDALAISKIKELQTTLSGKQPNITSQTDISFHDLRMSGNLVVDGSFISNHFIVENNILVMGELDISNASNGSALNVSQVGTGSVAIFNSGEEGNALLIDSSGNTTIYKKLEVIGDVSMNNASTTTLEVSNLVLRDDALAISKIKELQTTLSGKQPIIKDLSINIIDANIGTFDRIIATDIQGFQPLLKEGPGISIINNSISLSGEAGLFDITDNVNYFTETGYNIILGQQTNPNNSRLYVNGTITTADLDILSDKRVKDNIEDISNSLIILRQLHPKKYSKFSEVEYGFIANDVLDINDISFVVSHSDTYHTLNYNSLFSFNVQCIKDLDAEIEALRIQHNELEKMFFSKLKRIHN